LSINGECSSVDIEADEKWHENVAPVVEQYMLHNVFLVTGTALIYFAQPSRTLAVKG
jgi:hypothetical protein